MKYFFALSVVLSFAGLAQAQKDKFDLNSILFPKGSRAPAAKPKVDFREKEYQFLKTELKLTPEQFAAYQKHVDEFMEVAKKSKGTTDQAKTMDAAKTKIHAQLLALFGKEKFDAYQSYRDKSKCTRYSSTRPVLGYDFRSFRNNKDWFCRKGGVTVPGRDSKDCFGGPTAFPKIGDWGPPYTRYGLRPLVCLGW